MSDIRKAIMSRLGEFARPGAKAKMGKFNSGDSVVVPYGREMVRGKIVRYDEPSMAYVVDIGRYESIKVAKEDVRKAAMSRPGAKAKMARWEESHAEGWGDLSKTLTATINGTRWTIVVDASTGKGQLMRSTGRGPQVVKEGAVDQLKRYAETARASRPGAKARFAENCGTGAGGFKPGNKCGADDGKGGGGSPEDKKQKPKRTPLAGPKVAKPAKIPSRNTLNDLAQNAPNYREDWQDAEDVLSGRTDPQGKKLSKEMSRLIERWAQLQDDIDNMPEFPSKKNREAHTKKRKAIGDELNLLQQRAKRIIREVGKTERTAKRSPIEQAGNLVHRTIKAQEALGGWSSGLLSDVGDARSDLRKRGGAGSGKMRKSLKAMEEEWRGLQREVEGINADYIDMKEKQPDNEQEARELKQRAGQLLQKTGDWRKRAQELVKQVKAQASRTGDRQLFALAVRAQKILAHRPGVKAQMGLLDRLGTVATAAVSAATAKPFDPTNPQVAKDLEAAKRAAITEVNNYKFFKEFNDAQFRALDDYVKATAKSIAGLRSSQDVARLTNGIKQAVAARNLIRKTLKTPFSRPGAKAEMGKFKVGDRVAYKPHPAHTAGELVEIRKPTSLEGVEMQYGIKQASGGIMWVPEGMIVRASRPGAKATAAKPERKAKNCTVDAKPLAYGKGDDALEREDVKAGLKLMEKADPKVSEKIRTLIKEGKPQDQAVAIALDMKRRGEL